MSCSLDLFDVQIWPTLSHTYLIPNVTQNNNLRQFFRMEHTLMLLGGISFSLLIARIKLLIISLNVSVSMSRWHIPNSTSLFFF
jgi:hypothetical protein